MSTQTLILESPHIVAIEQDKLEPDNETETQAETQDYSAFEGSKRRIPLLLETIIIIIIGLAIILTPGLISIFYYCADVNKTNVSQLFNITANGNVVFGRYIATGMAIEGLPFIIYSVFLSISWCAFFGFRYAFNIVH